MTRKMCSKWNGTKSTRGRIRKGKRIERKVNSCMISSGLNLPRNGKKNPVPRESLQERAFPPQIGHARTTNSPEPHAPNPRTRSPKPPAAQIYPLIRQITITHRQKSTEKFAKKQRGSAGRDAPGRRGEGAANRPPGWSGTEGGKPAPQKTPPKPRGDGSPRKI